MGEEKSYGWNFPVGIDYHTGNICMTDIKSDIRQSLLILLSTTPGERLIHGTYGCNLRQFMFEPVTYELIQKIRWTVLHAILQWEKRIQNVEIDILSDAEEESRIVIHIRYSIPVIREVDTVYYGYSLQ